MSDAVKEAIKAEINKTNDPSIRAVLTLLQSVLEDIKDRLDQVMHDDSIKSKALNGHMAKHHIHHDWLDGRIEREEEYNIYRKRVSRVVDFVEKRIDNNGLCAYANKMILQEEKNKKDARTIVMKFIESIVNQFGVIIVTGTLVYLGIKVL